MNSHQKHKSFELELVTTCDLCGGKIFGSEVVVNGWNLNKCIKCNLVFTSPRYTELYLEKMYKERYYDVAYNYLQGQLSEPSQDLIDLARSLMRRWGGSEKSKSTRSLDVGCGGGHVVSAFQKAGWGAIGIDLSLKAVSAGKARGLDLRPVSIEDQTLGKFELISALHVLEHIHGPKQFLHRCAERLDQGGYLLIEVPDYGCRASRKKGQRWPYIYPDGHLYQFTVETIRNYLNQTGFEVTQTRRVHGRGPLEDYSTCPTSGTEESSALRGFIFSMRHLVYWSPLCRRIIRYLLWNSLGFGEFIRVLARKRSLI